MGDEVANLTVEILKQIRDEIRELRGEAQQSNTRLASLETKVEVMNSHLYSVHRDLRELIDGRVQGLERRIQVVEQRLGVERPT